MAFNHLVKVKTIAEIHSEAEKTLGLRPVATANIRNGHNAGALRVMSPGGFPVTRTGSGGVMPGMPGTRKMQGIPGCDANDWEVPPSQSMPRGSGSGPVKSVVQVQQPLLGKSPSLTSKFLPQGSGGLIAGKTSALLHGGGAPPAHPSSIEPVDHKPVVSAAVAVSSPEKTLGPTTKLNLLDLQRKVKSLLEEYFSIRLLDEAQQCIEELKAPAFHLEVVKEAVALALEKIPSCLELVIKLINFILSQNVFTSKDIGTGCLLYGSLLDDIGIDLPKAPNN
ncbi:hypothetical protein SLEP1_g1787 [Rubroshorea leprosula]|uniref:MI domain-containing protein n=1 Tax=Rubroshorea leprosula TaxID=152421 RepID=A0AAV5HEY7_9ROSI|nr:hypothetical protein SLEP1_g1787 [Rubroshorea leprosula]